MSTMVHPEGPPSTANALNKTNDINGNGPPRSSKGRDDCNREPPPNAGRSRPRKRQRPPQQQPSPLKQTSCCSVCTTGDPNYKCPKCRAIYCSIACCRRHKLEFCAQILSAAAATESSTHADIVLLEATNGSRMAPSKYLNETELKLAVIHHKSRLRSQNDNNNAADEFDNCEEGWKITDSMKESLQKSSWLHQELREDQGLLYLIAQITSASNLVVSSSTHHHRRNNHNTKIQGDPSTRQEELLKQLKASNPQFKLFLDKLLVTAGVLERLGSGSEQPVEEWLSTAATTISTPTTNLVLRPLPSKVRPAREEPPSSSDENSSTEDESSDSSDSSSSEESSSE